MPTGPDDILSLYNSDSDMTPLKSTSLETSTPVTDINAILRNSSCLFVVQFRVADPDTVYIPVDYQ